MPTERLGPTQASREPNTAPLPLAASQARVLLQRLANTWGRRARVKQPELEVIRTRCKACHHELRAVAALPGARHERTGRVTLTGITGISGARPSFLSAAPPLPNARCLARGQLSHLSRPAAVVAQARLHWLFLRQLTGPA